LKLLGVKFFDFFPKFTAVGYFGIVLRSNKKHFTAFLIRLMIKELAVARRASLSNLAPPGATSPQACPESRQFLFCPKPDS